MKKNKRKKNDTRKFWKDNKRRRINPLYRNVAFDDFYWVRDYRYSDFLIKYICYRKK